MVIFGASGDLTKRLVVPALYNLTKANLLPEKFALIGVDHNAKTTEEWRNALHDFLEQSVKQKGGEFEAASIDEDVWNRLAASMIYFQGDFLDLESLWI